MRAWALRMRACMVAQAAVIAAAVGSRGSGCSQPAWEVDAYYAHIEATSEANTEALPIASCSLAELLMPVPVGSLGCPLCPVRGAVLGTRNAELPPSPRGASLGLPLFSSRVWWFLCTSPVYPKIKSAKGLPGL